MIDDKKIEEAATYYAEENILITDTDNLDDCHALAHKCHIV